MARGAPPRAAAPRGDRQAHEEGRAAAGDQGAVAGGCRAEPPRETAAEAKPRGRATKRAAGAPAFGSARVVRAAEAAQGQPAGAAAAAARSRADAKAPAERRKGDYTLPPLALLDAPKTERKIDERELMDGARLLEEKCREFAVEGAVVQIHPGPVVTTFEFKPDAGVKYSKITGLADDLCLAMQAESVLIDRIPGKSTVGIQIPNHNREQISLRELLESERLPPLDVEAHARARQDHPRRAVHGRSGDDAAPADRGIDRHRQVGRHQRRC